MEKCRFCEKEIEDGIWMSPQFKDEKVLLFCSEKCKKEYLNMKLNRIKIEYPKYYDKLLRSKDKGIFLDILE